MEDAKRGGNTPSPRPSSSKNFEERDYTDEQIKSVMINIDDLEDDEL